MYNPITKEWEVTSVPVRLVNGLPNPKTTQFFFAYLPDETETNWTATCHHQHRSKSRAIDYARKMGLERGGDWKVQEVG